MSQKFSFKFDFSSAFFCLLFGGLLFCLTKEFFRSFLSVTCAIWMLAFAMVGSEELVTAYPDFFDETLAFWSPFILYTLLQSLVGGIVLSDRNYYGIIDSKKKPIGLFVGLSYLWVVLYDDTTRAEVFGWISNLNLWIFDTFSGLIDWLGSIFAFFLFLLVVQMLVYGIVHGHVLTAYESAAGSSKQNINEMNRKLSRVNNWFLVSLSALIGLAAASYDDLVTVLYTLPVDDNSVNILLILVALGLLFYLPNIGLHYPDGAKKEPQTQKRLKWLPPVCFIGFLVSLSIGILGFFPNSAPNAWVASLLKGGHTKVIVQESKNAAQKALERGDNDKAIEEYGYALSAAGASGDLDELEAMLNEMEKLEKK